MCVYIRIYMFIQERAGVYIYVHYIFYMSCRVSCQPQGGLIQHNEDALNRLLSLTLFQYIHIYMYVLCLDIVLFGWKL